MVQKLDSNGRCQFERGEVEERLMRIIDIRTRSLRQISGLIDKVDF